VSSHTHSSNFSIQLLRPYAERHGGPEELYEGQQDRTEQRRGRQHNGRMVERL